MTPPRCRPVGPRMLGLVCSIACLFLFSLPCRAEVVPEKGTFDARVRVLPYNPDQVIKIAAFVGYQVHFQFAANEEFVNLGTGDRDGIDVGKEGNHLFIKPRVERVGTNITLLTNRRVYHLHYTALRKQPNPAVDEIIYSIRFTYPEDEAREARARHEREEREAKLKALASAPPVVRNQAYEFCGHESLRPVSAFDDGIHTRVRFAARAEVPAIFLKNDDGSESLVNLSVERDEIILHRIARQWILRRGLLVGCIRNTAFEGVGARLSSGTVNPDIEREVRRPDSVAP